MERCKDSNTLVDAKSILGSLEAIKGGIDKGLLVRFEDLVFAEVFVDLMDQAEYLPDQGFLYRICPVGHRIVFYRSRLYKTI